MTDGPKMAFFTEEDGHYLPLPLARSLWGADTLTGPAVCGIAARAAETAYGRDGFRPARFTVDLFKVARGLPTRTVARVLRDGGRIRVVEVDVLQDRPSGDEVSNPVGFKPVLPISSPRKAFCNASWKLRPMAITSPTDFICVVSRASAAGNFSNAKRGILVTT